MLYKMSHMPSNFYTLTALNQYPSYLVFGTKFQVQE